MPVTHSPGNASGGIDIDTMNNTICAICSEVLQSSRDRVETPCNHHFHIKCIHTWLENNETCPVCRQACNVNDLKSTNVDVEIANPPTGQRTGAIPRKRPNTRSFVQSNPNTRITAASAHTAHQTQSPRNRTGGRQQETNVNVITEPRVRDLIVESLNVFREEITNDISNDLRNMLRNLNLA
ncbi:putative RING-H2 finger protein ATL37, partial [Rhagoletis pomonella]|uniref:putative RING-H2 finger protein ATL37 n=1 Tax=Rhagoletis pomonella TaxID=28610 RepID=UPI00178462BE